MERTHDKKISQGALKIVVKLLENNYGMQCESVSELNGYDDKNYRIKPNDNYENKHISSLCGDGYVLKILNSDDSKNVSTVEAQNEMMLYLGENGINCTKLVKNVKGEYYSLECTFGKEPNIVRLMEFVPGSVLNDTTPSISVYYEIGKLVGRMNAILKTFKRDALKSRTSLWMLTSVPELQKFKDVVENVKDRQIVEDVIRSFNERVLQKMSTFEKGTIHGDMNENNIIVKNIEEAKIEYGIIDFGDAQHSCYVFELAITLTYMMLMSKNVNVAGHLIAGYRLFREIPKEEFEVLKVCIAARLCQSLVLGLYFGLKNPNNAYILSSQSNGWNLLRTIWSIPEDTLYEEWKGILNNYTTI